MPSKTKKQQKMFGTALAIKRGEQPTTYTPAGHVVSTMSKSKIREFARNPEGDLLRAGMDVHAAIRENPEAKINFDVLGENYKLNNEQKQALIAHTVNVLQFCHQLNVQGKCHHGECDIEPQGTATFASTQYSQPEEIKS
jgi:hypothetical protein